MKKNTKIIIPILFYLIPIICFSQRILSPELMNIKDVFNVNSFERTTWELYSNHNHKEYAPVRSGDVIKYIDKYLSKTLTKDGRNGEIKEFNLIKKYRSNLDSIFQRFGLLGSDQLGEFLFDKDISVPVQFGLYSDSALSLIISGAYIDNVYNTLKLTSKQRATKVLTTYILSSLKSYAKSFNDNEIKYFGMTCIYGSKDFSDESPLATKAEFLAFIAPVSLIRKYVSGDLTEDELVNTSDIYVCDRDMVTDIKKIKIIIE